MDALNAIYSYFSGSVTDTNNEATTNYPAHPISEPSEAILPRVQAAYNAGLQTMRRRGYEHDAVSIRGDQEVLKTLCKEFRDTQHDPKALAEWIQVTGDEWNVENDKLTANQRAILALIEIADGIKQGLEAPSK